MKRKAATLRNPWDPIPRDLMRWFFATYIESPHDQFRVALVCKRFREHVAPLLREWRLGDPYTRLCEAHRLGLKQMLRYFAFDLEAHVWARFFRHITPTADLFSYPAIHAITTLDRYNENKPFIHRDWRRTLTMIVPSEHYMSFIEWLLH